MSTFALHESVVLRASTKHGLPVASDGVIVDAYPNVDRYTVELTDGNGDVLLLDCAANELRPFKYDDMSPAKLRRHLTQLRRERRYVQEQIVKLDAVIEHLDRRLAEYGPDTDEEPQKDER